jgi:tRNA (cmo5U34)-methyltransferase
MTSADPLGAHDWHDGAYVDRWIGARRESDADRRSQMRRVAAAIAVERDTPIRVLDIGVGYGALTEELLRVFPSARVLGVDFSEPMLEHAARNLARFGDQVTFARADLQNSDWAVGLDGPFDAVVSSQAIHNVRHPERVRQIYAEVATIVAPGGCFMNLDIFSPPGDRAGATYAAAAAGPEVAPPGVTKRAAPPLPLREQLAWLDEAGFVEVDVLFKDLRQGMIVGYRP